MKKTTRTLFIILPLLLVLAAAGYLVAAWLDSSRPSQTETVSGETYRSGPFRVTVNLQPRTPQVGENRLLLRITDSRDEPVSSATIRAWGEMPAMGAMSAMRAPVSFKELKAGLYAGEFKLEMGGEWPLTLTISKKGLGETRLGFDMATGRAGLSISSGGSPILSGGKPDKRLLSTDTQDHDISHYSCSMHPSVHEAEPGQCPICGMDLVPVTEEEAASGTITIDSRRRQMIGVKTAQATHQDLTRLIRAVGQIGYDERRISDVSLKFDAWVGELKADSVGVPVKRGQVLFTVYSPELLSAQQEYLETRQRLARRGPDDSLVQAARKRLMLWDISPAQVRLLEQRGTTLEYLPIHAPASGIVIEKNVVEGSHAMAGKTLLRIADLSKVWVDAEVYEADLPLISEGMAATVSLPYLPNREFTANVDYIYPYLEGKTRTARIRLVLDNPDGVLKPDMYAEVKLAADLGHRLAIPEEAVLMAGESRIVFVDLGEGKLKPVKVKTGQRVAGWVVIDEGLKPGDTVVTSGTFLIAAEARLKTGIDQW